MQKGKYMNLDEFMHKLSNQTTENELLDFCRKYVIHGTPHVFINRNEDFYEFKKRISCKFDISFHEVFITGSGKLGFSPFKNKTFDYDSDIDIALISPVLFESIMKDVSRYQMRFRKAREVVSEKELIMYHEFLEYVALGWIRPDKLPISFQMKTFKNDWFAFFQSISNGHSEVGNYKVSAGVFKSYEHLEEYILSGMKDLNKKCLVRNK